MFENQFHASNHSIALRAHEMLTELSKLKTCIKLTSLPCAFSHHISFSQLNLQFSTLMASASLIPKVGLSWTDPCSVLMHLPRVAPLPLRLQSFEGHRLPELHAHLPIPKPRTNGMYAHFEPKTIECNLVNTLCIFVIV